MIDNNQKKLLLTLSGLVLGVAGIVGIYKFSTPLIHKACKAILDKGQVSPMEARGPVHIEGQRVKVGPMSRRIVTVGKLGANKSVMIRAEMPGIIADMPFREGDDVREGDLLFQFKDADIQAELAQAQSELDLYTASFERIDQLRNQRIESLKNLDEVRARRDMAKAKVEAAQAKLAKSRIEAPFDGTIGLSQFNQGAFVQAAQELVMLVDNSVLLVDFKAPESYLNDISVGQTAEVKLDGFNKVFRANVEAIDSRIDPQSHSIAIRASLPNDERNLRSGLFATVSLIIGEKSNALMVPEAAVQREGDIEYVWFVQDGKADRKRIVTGTRENAFMEVVAGGLRPDEIVVTSGHLKLVPGGRVRISNMPELYEDEEKISDIKGADAEPASLLERLKAKLFHKAEDIKKPEEIKSIADASAVEKKPDVPSEKPAVEGEATAAPEAPAPSTPASEKKEG